jgi:hypothetical protein
MAALTKAKRGLKLSERSTDTIYIGTRSADGCGIVWMGGPGRPKYTLTPTRSLKVRNHSPTGFEWGYGGSGPAQTALALLLHWTGDHEVATSYYQDFKFAVVAGFGQTWQITGQEISDFLTRKRIESLSQRANAAKDLAPNDGPEEPRRTEGKK